MFQRRERVRSARLEASPDIAEYVANAVRFDQAIALRGIGKSRTHFRFADQALPNKRPEDLCHAASCPAAPSWRTVGKPGRLVAPGKAQGELVCHALAVLIPFSASCVFFGFPLVVGKNSVPRVPKRPPIEKC